MSETYEQNLARKNISVEVINQISRQDLLADLDCKLVISGGASIYFLNEHGLVRPSPLPARLHRRITDIDFGLYTNFPVQNEALLLASVVGRLKANLEAYGHQVIEVKKSDMQFERTIIVQLAESLRVDDSDTRSLQIDITGINNVLLPVKKIQGSFLYVANNLDNLAYKLARVISMIPHGLSGVHKPQDLIDIPLMLETQLPRLKDLSTYASPNADIKQLRLLTTMTIGLLYAHIFASGDKEFNSSLNGEQNDQKFADVLKGKFMDPNSTLTPHLAKRILTYISKLIGALYPNSRFTDSEREFFRLMEGDELVYGQALVESALEALKVDNQDIFDERPELEVEFRKNPWLKSRVQASCITH